MNITVFTPTYNRGYIIEELYKSLRRQNYFDFEWLVIDDGSTDNTEELFKKWIEQDNKFTIRYYKKENGGKCRALNYALDKARGRLFFTVDSDDYLTDDALYKIANWEESLPKSIKYCGLAGNLGFSDFETPNTYFEKEFYDGNLLDRYRNIDGERAFVFYTDVHKKYKYPEFENENFITEAVVWNRMANDGYKMRFYNDIIWIYEYRNDGLTLKGNSIFVNNPNGYGLWVREKIRFLHFSIIQKIKAYYNFTCEMSKKYSCNMIAGFLKVNVVGIRILFLLSKIKSTLIICFNKHG